MPRFCAKVGLCRGLSESAKSPSRSLRSELKIDCSRRYLDGVLETGSQAASSVAGALLLQALRLGLSIVHAADAQDGSLFAVSFLK